MAFNNLTIKKQKFVHKNTNIVDLIKKSKLEEKKGKRQTYLIAAATVSALVVSGYIISQ